MKKIYLSAVFFIALSAGAQNLNPTVSVTRDYEGKLMEVHKPSMAMFVPDSLHRFDLDFDYSVFANPYKGAYDFKPYVLEMRPDAEPYSGRKLYLKAGAGYQLRPMLDFVWEPQLKTPKFKMDVYASHHSYIGDYKNIELNSDNKLVSMGNAGNGYDMYSNAGINGQADLNMAKLSFDAGYVGIHTKFGGNATGYNAAEAGFRAKSENDADTYFYYDVDFRYHGANQGIGDGVAAGGRSLRMNDIDFNVTLGPVMHRYHSIVADFGVGLSYYRGALATDVGTAYITPKYVLNKNRWRLHAGPKFSFNISDRDGADALNTNKGILIYPDVYIGFEAVRNYMNLYFKAEGGDYRNPYKDMKEKFHFLLPYSKMSNNSVMQADFALGFNGNICSRFRYDIRAGFRSFEAMPFDFVTGDSSAGTPLYSAGWTYNDGTAVYSDIKLQWESRDFVLDSKFTINDIRLKNSENLDYVCFEPAKVSGFISGKYNWKKRIFAGVSAEFASKRDGRVATYAKDGSGTVSVTMSDARIPGWMNLGVYAEFAFTRKLSFWLRGDNLLNADIQRVPLYTEGGIGATVGICLNL